jgi:hypothetical protein
LETVELRLVEVNKYLVPANKKDLELLTQRSIRIYKIASDRLPTLKGRILKGLKVTVLKWADISDKVIRSVMDRPNVQEAIARWKLVQTEENNLELHVAWKYGAKNKEALDTAVSMLGNLLCRFCVRIRSLEWKNLSDARYSSNTHVYPVGSDLDRMVSKYSIIIDTENIEPTHGYGEQLSAAVDSSTIINLSRFSRLRLENSKSTMFEGQRSLVIVFEDLSGTTWVESLRRTLDVSRLKPEELLDGSMFLMALAGK